MLLYNGYVARSIRAPKADACQFGSYANGQCKTPLPDSISDDDASMIAAQSCTHPPSDRVAFVIPTGGKHLQLHC